MRPIHFNSPLSGKKHVWLRVTCWAILLLFLLWECPCCHFCILPVRYILGYPNPSGQMAWSLRPDKRNVWISQALPFTTIPFLKARIFLRHLISLIVLFLILYFFANCCQRRFTEQFRDCKLEFYCQNSMLKSPFQLQTSNSTCQARAHTCT